MWLVKWPKYQLRLWDWLFLLLEHQFQISSHQLLLQRKVLVICQSLVQLVSQGSTDREIPPIIFENHKIILNSGSNIFDVTVGLPLPWILKTAISKAPVAVEATGMFCSIALVWLIFLSFSSTIYIIFQLFMMLIFVFISIAAYKWKMTKGLGACMFLLYGAFVVISLLLQKSVIPCPFNSS